MAAKASTHVKAAIAPISKGASSLHPFFELRQHRWILTMLALLCSFFGGFCIIVGGYFFIFQEWNVWLLLLCLLLGVFAFSLVFALAHASYAVSFSNVRIGAVTI